MLFVGTVELLCYFLVQQKDCGICWYTRGTVLLVRTV